MVCKLGSKQIWDFNCNMDTLSPTKIPQTFRINFTDLGDTGSKDFIGGSVRGNLSLVAAH